MEQSQSKFWLYVSRFAHILIIGFVCLGLTNNYIKYKKNKSAPAIDQQLAAPARIKTGDILPTIKNWDYADVAPKGVILFASTACHFCQESLPFYQKLSTGLKGKFTLVYQEDAAEVAKYLKDNGYTKNYRVIPSFEPFKVSAYPTMAIVNDKGEVQEVRVGKLTPALEKEFIKTNCNNCKL